VRLDEANGLAESRNARSNAIEWKPDRFVFALEPTGAKTQFESTLRKEIQRGGFLGEHCRRSIVDAEDATADPQRRSRLGRDRHGGYGGERLQRVIGRLERGARPEDVIGEMQRGVALVLGLARAFSPLARGISVERLDTESKGSGHYSPLALRPRMRTGFSSIQLDIDFDIDVGIAIGINIDPDRRARRREPCLASVRPRAWNH
jgi:hypothetical protein